MPRPVLYGESPAYTGLAAVTLERVLTSYTFNRGDSTDGDAEESAKKLEMG